MIGMIALAGIIVRNSILLVDFVNQQVDEGVDFQEAVIRAGAVRAKPIALTAVAVTLIFGILVSTLLTLVVIPVLYYAFGYSKGQRID
jgi:multidrug efflux pump subunit AcrB